MFERFTQSGRNVVVLSQKEARGLKHSYIGTEHILLGLLGEQGGIAAKVLDNLDVTAEGVRAQVLRIIGPGDDAGSGQIPFTPRAKKVLELSVRESERLGHNYIGPEHILLGLVRETEGVAARILLEHDAEPERVEREVIRMLSGPGSRTQKPPGERAHRVAVEPTWLDWLDLVLERLAPAIRSELRREPDGGDLLLVLACAPHTTTARTLQELGVELDALSDTIKRIRRRDQDPERRARAHRPPDDELLEAICRQLGLARPGSD